jgi:hypothetical protein
MAYLHTQRGTAILWMVWGGALTTLAVYALATWRTQAGFHWAMLIAPAIIVTVFAAVGWYFSSMTVEVTDDELRWRIGRGGVNRVARSGIESARIVRHPLWHGYGIRWLGRGKWTYIVAGRDTVEVRLKDGGWRRIGTDDPRGLLAALGRPTS